MANVTIPLGYKFKFEPEDYQLMVYLSCKANGEPLPCEGPIREIDLYHLPDPGKLFEGTEEKVVYVFTELKKVSQNGKRVDRTVLGNRTWKGVDGAQPIYDAEGRRVGEKKNFVLVNKMKTKLGYNMKEFSLDKQAIRNPRFNDYVLCQIKKKAKKARSLKDVNFPEEDTCNTAVSMPAIEGDVMAYSEGYQRDESNSIALVQSQEEQAQQCYQFSESQEGRSNLMPMLCGDFDFDKALIGSGIFEPSAEEYQYQEINSWITDNMVEGFAQNWGEQSNGLSVLDMINSTAFDQPQEKQEQQCYRFSEPQEVGSNFMPMLCGDFDSDKALISSEFFVHSAEEYHYQEVNSWITENMVEEFAQNQGEQAEEINELSNSGMINELTSAPSVSWNDIYCGASALTLPTGMIAPTLSRIVL